VKERRLDVEVGDQILERGVAVVVQLYQQPIRGDTPQDVPVRLVIERVGVNKVRGVRHVARQQIGGVVEVEPVVAVSSLERDVLVGVPLRVGIGEDPVVYVLERDPPRPRVRDAAGERDGVVSRLREVTGVLHFGEPYPQVFHAHILQKRQAVDRRCPLHPDIVPERLRERDHAPLHRRQRAHP